ncbi:MAG: pentapeptide repeat-containing protein [Aggregatilineales bacterium]
MLDNLTIQEVTLLVVGILLLLSFITAMISLFLETDRTRQWYGDWFQGVSTEMVGAAVTTIFFTFIVGAAEQRQEALTLQTGLIQQMGSVVNTEALRAVEELRDNGWLRDGTLQGHEFYSTNLADVFLPGADITGSIFFDANFENAELVGSDFTGANLQGVNFTNTRARDVIFRGATFNAANLLDADLRGADLRGANLADANLRGVLLETTIFDETTILPDADFDSETGAFTPNWQPDTDMSRFTDASHSDFWQPIEPYPWWFDIDS